jgi:protein subunit release factor A
MDEIDERDLRIDVYRTGGVNIGLSISQYPIVKITHLPTGLIVSCQEHSSALENKAKALEELREKIREHQR